MIAKPPLFQLTRPLTSADLVDYQAEFEKLQGNILKSHGREASASVFLTFKAGKATAVKRFLRELNVTSAAEQQRQILRFKQDGKSELFVGLCLSAQGYEFLGNSVTSFSPEFQQGMRSAGSRLNDAPVNQWDAKFQGVIHAMILLAHDLAPELTKEMARLQTQGKDLFDESNELGRVMRNAAEDAIEHFGYADGLSQPLFFADQITGLSTGNWDPSAGPNLVLVRDPLGSSDQDCGTYYVFRKLEQNVRGFKQREQALADALNLSGPARELAGAMVVGRFEDGTPVVLTNRAGGATERNDFAYPSVDSQGNKCPFAAHIRKTNPRGDSARLDERARRIVRRGITYGDRTFPERLDSLPEGGVGLLFQCCQSSLADQFEFIQGSWASNDGFAKPDTGKDPVIGQSLAGPFPDLGYPPTWNEVGRTPFSFHGFVTLKGGEYFFAPSISYLKAL